MYQLVLGTHLSPAPVLQFLLAVIQTYGSVTNDAYQPRLLEVKL